MLDKSIRLNQWGWGGRTSPEPDGVSYMARGIQPISFRLVHSHRELDRERMGLEQQEKKIVIDIKKMAKEGQMVRIRGSDANEPALHRIHTRHQS